MRKSVVLGVCAVLIVLPVVAQTPGSSQAALTSAINALTASLSGSTPAGSAVIGRLAATAIPTTPSNPSTTTAGTFQQALAANAARGSMELYNPSVTDACYVYLGTTSAANAVGTAGTLPLKAGAYYARGVGGAGDVPSDAVQFTCASAGDKIVVTEQSHTTVTGGAY